MDDRHPKRRKDKYNPYTLSLVDGKCYLSFKDGQGFPHKLELDVKLYALFDRFELDDLSFLNEQERHLDQTELSEALLSRRVPENQATVEDAVYESLQTQALREGIRRLPEIQKRRLQMTMLPVTAWAEVSSQGETATYTVTVKEPNPDRKPWEIWKPEEIAVSGATVEVWGEGQEEAAASATTDEDGKAELSWAMDDSIPQWTCRISKLGYGEQELEIDPLSNETESTVILNQTAYLVVGESEDESEEVPLQGVTIKFIPKDGESGEPITIMTDEDGQFYIAGQLEEKVAYDLEITLSGYKPLTVESFDPAITEYKLQKLDGNEVYFNKEEFHATFGEEIEDYPELVFDPKESGTGRKIEYSIDLPGKVADIDRETGELTILHTGRATVTATVEANEQYERAKATYTLIVEKAKPELKFAFSENTFSDGDGTEKTPYVLTYGTDLRDGLKIEVTSTNSEEENFNYEVESFSAEENEDNSPYFDPKDPSLLRFGDGWTGKAHIQEAKKKRKIILRQKQIAGLKYAMRKLMILLIRWSRRFQITGIMQILP